MIYKSIFWFERDVLKINRQSETQGTYSSQSTLWPLLLLVPCVVYSAQNPLSPFSVCQSLVFLQEPALQCHLCDGPFSDEPAGVDFPLLPAQLHYNFCHAALHSLSVCSHQTLDCFRKEIVFYHSVFLAVLLQVFSSDHLHWYILYSLKADSRTPPHTHRSRVPGNVAQRISRHSKL